MSGKIGVPAAADGIVAFAALYAGRGAHKAGADELHRGVVHVAQGGHNLREAVFLGKLRRGTGRELVIDGPALLIGRDAHLVVVPPIAAALGPHERPVHKLSPERLIAIHEFQSAKGRQNQVFLHLLDLPEGRDVSAHGIVAHDGDAIVGAARAVVKILLSAKVGAPVGKISRILLLHPFPDRLALIRGIVQRNFAANLPFALP